jgi:peptidoglycan hydrolase-like protein with peptidoglycan-binding domain
LRLGSRDTIRFVQKSLLNLGYDPGGADGASGKRTPPMIRKYEKDNGLRDRQDHQDADRQPQKKAKPR